MMKMLKTISLTILVALTIAFTFTSCEKAEDELGDVKLENGLYVGLISVRYPSAYEVVSGQVNLLGSSEKLSSFVPITENAFTGIPENTNFSPFVCQWIKITKNDYKPSASEQEKNFGGLWYAMNTDQISHNSGLIMAIKPEKDGWQIILNGLNGRYEKTVGQLKMVSGHQELSFEVSSEITGEKTEIWTVNPAGISGYDFRTNVLDMKSVGNFFQFIAIHN